jgi:hypothetical protein
VREVNAFDELEESVHEVLARLLAVANDVDAGVFLLLQPEQRGIVFRLRELRALRPPSRPKLSRLREPGWFRQASGNGGFEHVSGSSDSDEIVTSHYNRPLQREVLSVFGMVVGTFCSFVMGLFNPYVVNKAGPDWMWGGGRNDVVRNLYFRHDGSFRRYGRLALIATLFGGSAAVFWML